MIERRKLIGAGLFCGLAGVTSVGAMLARSAQAMVPGDRKDMLNQAPDHIGPWQFEPSTQDMIDPVITDVAFAQALELYDLVVGRDYVAAKLPRIMLNMSYKRTIRQEERFHWPEFCYATQGFRVTALSPIAAEMAGQHVSMARFLAQRDERNELVCYIMRIGPGTMVGSMAVRTAILKESLAFRVPDGTMTRVSFLLPSNEQADIDAGAKILTDFVGDLYRASTQGLRSLLI